MNFSLPHQLCGNSDDPFVRKSVVERLPAILDSIVQKEERIKPEAKEKIANLALEIRQGTHVVVSIDGADQGPDWVEYCERRVGKSSMEVDWWFLENYAYRLVMNYIDYFRSSDADRIDPFASHKGDALESGLRDLSHAGDSAKGLGAFHSLVTNALWGNQVDLSFSSGQLVEEAKGKHQVLDMTNECWNTVFEGGMVKNITYILDNCGAELLNDLILIQWILDKFPECTCVIHAKSHPVFVSDAIETDVHLHIASLCSHPLAAIQGVGKSLQTAQDSNRLKIKSHPFYTSPLPFWDAPTELKAEYAASSLTILKGDANYRRLIEDRMFPVRTSFKSLMSYWGSASLLSIRTCKSPCAIGLPISCLESIPSPDWLVNGKTGLVSFYSQN